MLPLSNTRVFLALGSTDMRKAINGLSIMVEQHLSRDPFSGDLFVFCNRRRNMVKILYWDKNGFCLWQKRLEKQKFPWPGTSEEAREISFEQLSMLLAGIDFFKAHQELSFSRV